MKPGSNKSSRSTTKQRGLALVIVLAFVVLVTGLVLAFFSRTLVSRQVSNSSAAQTKTEILARSAADLIIGDLKQEIVNVNGSDAATTAGVTIYTPSSDTTVLPQRSGNPGGSPNPIPNLIRRSVRNDPMSAPGVGSRASAAASTDPSLNERSVSAARWNAHYLIPRLNPGSNSTDTEPTSSFTAPDWVIVTRDGPTAFSSWNNSLKDASLTNPNFAVGRYAFAIYDQGGLLDVNVAGYPSGLSPEDIGEKGTLALADLTQLPTTPAVTQDQVDQIVGWRNYASAQPGLSGSFGSYTFSGNSTNWLTNFVRDNTSGFTEVFRSAPPTDQMFLSRQQLIKLSKALGISPDALQYLGTFSRALNAPSWTPPLNASQMVNYSASLQSRPRSYKDDADNANSVNRNLPNVRVKTPFTRADGTTAQVGEPLIKTRFPLSRLAGVGRNGPVTTGNSTMVGGVVGPATDATVLRDFGLEWNSSLDGWVYADGTIRTLDEVATQGREPNFFELLKAGILDGSLGKSFPNDTGIRNRAPDIDTDLQIFTTGANLIDQADTDDVPTKIVNPADATKIVLGIENHPYIYLMSQNHFRRMDRDYNPSNAQNPLPWVTAYQQLQVWNPHLNAEDNGGTYRIRALQGQSRVTLQPNDSYIPFLTAAGISVLLPNASGRRLIQSPANDQTDRFISFPGTRTYAEPVQLTPSTITASSPENRVASMVGFHFGDLFAPNNLDGDNNSSNDYRPASFTSWDVPQILQLEYQDGAAWVPVQRIYPLTGSMGFGGDLWVPGAEAVFNNGNTDFSLVWSKTDPRVQRFGVYGAAAANRLNNQTFRRNTNAYHNAWGPGANPGGKIGAPTFPGWYVEYPLPRLLPALKTNYENFGYPPDELSDNDPGTSDAWVADPDGVVRLADGTRATNIPGDKSGASAAVNPRPVMLNRPFRSVGEIGYAMRGDPWKTLDLASASSADAALLDLFSVNEAPEVVAGVINLNSASKEVLQVILAGAGIDPVVTPADTFTAADASTVATTLANQFATTPIQNRADLVRKVSEVGAIPATTHKRQKEVLARALADVSNMRTWNLMIDVVAQTGRYPATATNLDDFVVEGERRLWVHIAIDRLTGEIIDQETEVYFQ